MAITTRALAFVSRWFDEATVRRTFEPLIADWQREWQDATPSRRPRVSARGLAALMCAALVSSPRIVLTRAPREVTDRIATRIVRFVAIATTILMVPAAMPMYSAWKAGASWPSIEVLLFTIPSALLLAFPFATAAGVDAIRRHNRLPAQLERAVALKLGLLAVAIMVIGAGWVLPAANQAARNAMNPPGMSAPLRSMRELSLYELVADPERATIYAPGTYLASRSTSLNRELNSRAMMIVLPGVLLWLRWRAYQPRRRRFRPVPVVVAAAASIAVMVACAAAGAWLEREQLAPMGSTYWLPIAVFWLWGLVSGRAQSLVSREA